MRKIIGKVMVAMLSLATLIGPGAINCKASGINGVADKAEVEFSIDNPACDEISGQLRIDTCDSITGEAIEKVGYYDFNSKSNKDSYFVDLTQLAQGSGEHWFVAEFKVNDTDKYTVSPEKYHVRITQYENCYGVSLLDAEKKKVDKANFIIRKTDVPKKITQDSSTEIDTGKDSTSKTTEKTETDTTKVTQTTPAPVKTGDDTNILTLIAIAGTALMTIIIVLVVKKKNEE